MPNFMPASYLNFVRVGHFWVAGVFDFRTLQKGKAQPIGEPNSRRYAAHRTTCFVLHGRGLLEMRLRMHCPRDDYFLSRSIFRFGLRLFCAYLAILPLSLHSAVALCRQSPLMMSFCIDGQLQFLTPHLPLRSSLDRCKPAYSPTIARRYWSWWWYR